MTTLPPELEGRLQEITCRVHDIELQNLIRDLVTEQQAEIDHFQIVIQEIDFEKSEYEKHIDDLESEIGQMKKDRSFAEDMWMEMMP